MALEDLEYSCWVKWITFIVHKSNYAHLWCEFEALHFSFGSSFHSLLLWMLCDFHSIGNEKIYAGFYESIRSCSFLCCYIEWWVGLLILKKVQQKWPCMKYDHFEECKLKLFFSVKLGVASETESVSLQSNS